jgi:glycerol-3-phosphate acyltransferase PlsY
VIAAVALLQLSPLYAVYAVAAAGLIWLFHLDNIQRLLSGSERQIEWRR